MSVHHPVIPTRPRRRAFRRGVTAVSALALATVGVTAGGLGHPPPAAASPGCGDVSSWDFDLDGNRDLAVGAPLFEPTVQLRLTNDGEHRHVAIPAPKGADGFGTSVASVSSHEAGSDTSFCSQLMVGAPDEEVNGLPGAGAIYLYGWDGSKMVLRARYVQGSNGVPGTPQPNGRFGASLASAPLSDGGSDSAIPLYVGAPGQDVGSVKGAGSVTELTVRDTPDGRADGSVITLATAGIPGEPSPDGALGHSLAAAGDVVVAGAPGQQVGSYAAGAALTFTRNADKITSPHLVTQATEGVVGNAELGDKFGYSVSAVALGGPGSAVETLVGVPGEDDNLRPYALEDSGVALSFRTDPATGVPGHFHGYQQGSGGVGGALEEGDQFGYSVSIQRRPNGTPLRLVGAPFEDIGTIPAAGAVNEVGAARNRLWVQGQKSPLVTGAPEAGDRFGFSVSGDSALIASAIGENRYGMVFGPWGYVGPLNKLEDGHFGNVVH